MKTVVVMQPQFFPWRGLFEQIRLADEFVHLDDAQFQKGGFTNRVQIKTASGPIWMTVPVLRAGSLPPINQVEIDYGNDWRAKHLRTFEMSYARAPYLNQARKILIDIYGERSPTIADLDIVTIERCSAELGLHPIFTRASSTPVDTMKTERVVDLLEPRGAARYVTGLGALEYLDEGSFAAAGIEVRVMAYSRSPYPQLHGTFDPHVSILDTIANLGPRASEALDSSAVSWDDAVRARKKTDV